MTETTAVAKREDHGVVSVALTPEDMKAHVAIIQEMMGSVMKDEEHYGKIPGCGNKPALFKPGAEKLSLTFGLLPKYDIQRENLENYHREYQIVTTLVNRANGAFMGSGVGSCSTMESKYRYRQGNRKCPKCQEETIFKSKRDGGWYCWAKKGGCGAKWKAGAPEIEKQECGKVENPDIADCYNTVLKMATKRSLVHAILTATAAGDIFAQDIEDYKDVDYEMDRESPGAGIPDAPPSIIHAPPAPENREAGQSASAIDHAQQVEPEVSEPTPPEPEPTFTKPDLPPPPDESAFADELPDFAPIDEGVKSMMLDFCGNQGVTQSDIESILQRQMIGWHEGHQKWLAPLMKRLADVDDDYGLPQLYAERYVEKTDQ